MAANLRSGSARRLRNRTVNRAARAAIEPLEGRLLLATLYQANMDANPGWTATGEWAWGVPAGWGGTENGSADPYNGATGTRVYGVNLFGDYSTAPGGPYYAKTQAINCAGYTGVQLSFQRWLNSDEYPYVSSTVEVSNNGTSWTSVYTNSSVVTDWSWSLQTYDISAVANNQATVYVRWGYKVDPYAFAYSGWNIDDVMVTGTSAGVPEITIPSFGTATPYPHTLNISGLTGNITDVNVKLNGVSHTWPDDMDILLVGPGGQKAMIMSDAGGSYDISDVNLVLDDEAAASLPTSTITSGTYKPTDHGAGDTFIAPAPAGPYTSLLSAFDGTAPNGAWKLYVYDDTSPDAGSISGWELVITTDANPISIPPVGLATPYPSTVNISGLSGTVTDVNLKLNGVTHLFPIDIDILLVGPAGQKVLVMSDAGGGFSLSGVNLVLDDEAATPLPVASAITTGTYWPTDYSPADTFPLPAPAGPYATVLSAFDGTNPNGVWSLYVVDDYNYDGGSIAGWELVITTTASVTGQITGSKWNDVDGDASWDLGEPGLANWRIYLDTNTNGLWDAGETSVLTNASGSYVFTNLPAGIYHVGEVAQAGWHQTSPGASGMSSSSGITPIDMTGITTTGGNETYSLQGWRIGEPIPLDQVVTPQTNVTGPLINIDDFRADPRFAGIDGSGMATVIIDTGIDLNHPFFGPDADANGIADRIVYSYDFSGANDPNASDTHGHGSNVSSIVASSDATYKGMAPAANIIHLKVFPDGSGLASSVDIEEALQWVVANAATYNVVSVNLSLGGGNYNSPFTGPYSDEMAALANAGVMVVAAAGNSFYELGSVQGVGYPAADPNAIAVGAVYDSAMGQMSWASGAVDFTTGADRIASFSQRTSALYEIMAPGPLSTGAGPYGDLTNYGGTSQASPHIAGIAALAQELAIQRIGRRLTLAEFRNLLTTTGVTIVDGDDENDNIANTGATFKRVDVLALGNAIYNMGATATPYQHTVTLTTGQFVTGRDFGNQQDAPSVTLSLSGNPMAEAGGSAIVTATLSQIHTQPVTVNLAFAGSAAYPADYTRTGTSIVIPAGSLTGSINLAAVQDILVESNETITVEISSVTNGLESGTQIVTATINDDDIPPGTISGGIWSDTDADGTWDLGENGLANWEVYLDANVNGQWDTGETRTTTNAAGSYTFTGVTPGVHVVGQTLQSGYAQTSPGANGLVKLSTIGSGGALASLPPATGFISIDSAPEGDAPRALAFTQNGNYILVANRDSDNVTVLNASTRAVVATVPAGDGPIDVAVNGTYGLVTNLYSNNVTVINLSTWAVTATVPITGTKPYAVKVTADGTKAVVGVINGANAASPSTFSVIDLNTLTQVRSFATTPQSELTLWGSMETRDNGAIYKRFAVAPDNRTIVLPDSAGSRVMIYDLATGSQWAALATPTGATAVDISTDGTTAVVSHQGAARKISVISLNQAASTVTSSLTTTADLDNYVIRITPTKSHAVVTSYNNVMFVNLATGATEADIPANTIFDLEFTYDGQYLFVPGYNPDLISLASRTIVKTYYDLFAHEAAASPNAMRIVALESREAEDVQFYNVNGALGSVEGIVQTGSAPEGDAPRYLAVSSDGKTAVTGNTISGNATIINLETETVRAYVATGGRVQSVAISPDNKTALVANMDSDTVTVIDLLTDTVVKTLSVPFRPDKIIISPNSSRAYVTSVTSGDRIHFITLAGASSTVDGSLAVGDYGSVGYDFVDGSGLALSPDGLVLAACSTFTSQVLLIDTTTRTLIKAIDTGLNSMPRRAVFSPSGTTLYAINANTHTVSVINVNGASSSLTTTISGMTDPKTIEIDAAGAFIYVSNDGNLKVISTATNTVVATLTLPGNADPNSSYLSKPEAMLYLMGAESSGMASIFRVRAQGATSALVDQVALNGAAMTLGFSESLKTAVVSMPLADGVAIVDYSPRLGGAYTVKLDSNETVALVNFGNSPDLVAPVLQAEPPYTAGTTNTVSWGSVAGATEYYMEWDTNSAFSSPDGNSGWTATTSAAATGLANGQIYYFRVKARNIIDESAWSNTVSSTQDSAAPAAPVVSSISNDTGVNATDEITSDTTLILTGTAEPSSTVGLFRNGTPIGSTTASVAGTWTFDYTGTTLADGSYNFTATATDAVGNTSAASAALPVTVDITGPIDLALDNSILPESTTAVRLVGNLVSTDPDAGDAFTYGLVAGAGDTDNGLFSIVGGQLWTAAGLDYETKQTYTIRVRSADRAGNIYEEPVTINLTNLREALVAGRMIFYNRSYFDGNLPVANVSDDNAIATDKVALLPGQTATFANYTSYSRGINGIMLDITGLPGTLSASDFEFRVGNSNTPSGWALAPAPTTIDIRTLSGSTKRVTLIWADNAIQKQWLQITVKASDSNDLPANDVFYFGNAIAESGNSTTNAIVNSSDDSGARLNPHTPSNRATITDVYDYNRDGLVNSPDQVLARIHGTTPSTALKLISVPVGPLGEIVLQGAWVAGSNRPSAASGDAKDDEGILDLDTRNIL